MSLVEIQINYQEDSAMMNNATMTTPDIACSDYLCVSRGKSESMPQSRCNSWKGRLDSGCSNAINSSIKHNYRRRKSSPRLTRNNSASMPDFSSNKNSITTTTTDSQLVPTNSYNCPVCMVRSFKTTSKGDVINIGSYCKVPSSNSLRSSGSLNTSHRSSVDSDSRRSSQDSHRAGSIDSTNSGDENRPSRLLTADIPNICVTPSYFRTLVLGSAGVGKTSLVQLFTKSTDSHNNEEEENWRSGSSHIVSVELDGSESTMEFIDGSEMDVELESYQVDAYILMYSVSEPASFGHAISLLLYLRLDLGSDRPVYLVANKTDLVRQSRVTAAEACRVASSHDCHFIETSNALNVNVDKLLVGVLCSIQRQLTPLSGSDIAFQQSRKGSRLRRYSGTKDRRGSNSSIGSCGSSIGKRKSLGLLGEETGFNSLAVPQASFSSLSPGFPAYSGCRNTRSSSFSDCSQQPKSSNSAFSAISNFIKQACRRESKRRDAHA